MGSHYATDGLHTTIMSGHLSLLVLDFIEPAGESAAFLEAVECFGITRLTEHRAAWNHVLATAPADVTLLLLPSDEGHGLRITLPDLLNHVRTCWKDTPIIAWSTSASSPVVQRVEKMGIDQVLHGEPEPGLLLPALAGSIEQILGQHVAGLNQQHTQIARKFRDLNANCGDGVSRTKFQAFTRLLADHFGFEEDFMRRHGYAALTEHAAGHQRLLDLSKEILAQCASNEAGVEDETRAKFRGEMERHIHDDGDYLTFIEQMREKVTAAGERMKDAAGDEPPAKSA